MKLYTAIARKLGAIERANDVWRQIHEETLAGWLREHMPSGSGFDSGCSLIREESNPEKLVFSANFRHMNETGFYSGWTAHKVIVTASLQYEFDIRVTGLNRNGIKEYIGEVFANLESVDVEEY